ncbi:MAG: hypothetical protein ACOY31_06350 [Bacillota bacterium]
MGVDINGGIFVKPIGVVRSEYVSLEEPPAPGLISVIELFPGYERALLRIGEHSHFWVLSWFHKARREVLATVPGRIDPDLPEYGVFGLRSKKSLLLHRHCLSFVSPPASSTVCMCG